jgi:glycosyltransferase involved in cell wall biosynthesis
VIRELGVEDRVAFPGELHPAEVDRWYARAQLVAFPVLREEPFGLVGVEALAHGKPIVAFAGGAVEEWLWPGETGLQVTEKTPAALGTALSTLLRDPDRCAAMGRAARVRYAAFTRDAYLDRLLTHFHQVRAQFSGS